MLPSCLSVFFFFNDTATTEIYTLSLHDALPISRRLRISPLAGGRRPRLPRGPADRAQPDGPGRVPHAAVQLPGDDAALHLRVPGGPEPAVPAGDPAERGALPVRLSLHQDAPLVHAAEGGAAGHDGRARAHRPSIPVHPAEHDLLVRAR